MKWLRLGTKRGNSFRKPINNGQAVPSHAKLLASRHSKLLMRHSRQLYRPTAQADTNSEYVESNVADNHDAARRITTDPCLNDGSHRFSGTNYVSGTGLLSSEDTETRHDSILHVIQPWRTLTPVLNNINWNAFFSGIGRELTRTSSRVPLPFGAPWSIRTLPGLRYK